jgi:dephospho-CoA kinase
VKLYGLTGGPGMGKSEAAAFLKERGVPVVDTDAIAREVVEPGQPGLDAVQREFGAEVVASDGTLDRALLARIVFQQPAARTRLEEILHPLIRQRWLGIAQRWRDEGEKVGVVVIPLLFETGAEQEFARVICIACSTRLQSARLHERGWNAAQVTGRLAAQWPIERKIDRSHYVIWNDSTIEVLRAQLGRVPPLKGSE